VDAPAGSPGRVDEVWIFSDHFFGLWEASMAGPSAFFVNGGVYPKSSQAPVRVLWVQLRARRRPRCCTTPVIAPKRTLKPRIRQVETERSAQRLGVVQCNASQSRGLAGVGTCHWPLTRRKTTTTTIPEWFRAGRWTFSTTEPEMPGSTSAGSRFSRDTWIAASGLANRDRTGRICSGISRLLPREPGTGLDERQNNWWKYV